MNDTLKTLEELKLKVAELEAQIKKESEIKPVFPEQDVYRLYAAGTSEYTVESALQAKQGNTFYTRTNAEKESLRREAEARVRERINLENKGDNGFELSGNNYSLVFDFSDNTMTYSYFDYAVYLNPWEYLRTRDSVGELLKDESFCNDWKLMKGIER